MLNVRCELMSFFYYYFELFEFEDLLCNVRNLDDFFE